MEIGLTDIETYTSIGANLVAITGIIVFIVEFNRYKKTNKIQAYQNRYQLYLEMDKILIEHPELKKLIGNLEFQKWLEQNQGTDSEIRSTAFIELVLNLCQLSYMQYKDRITNSEMLWMKELLKNKYVVAYWNSGIKCRYNKDFERFVKKELECSPKRKWEWGKKISRFSHRIIDFLS